MIVNKPLEPELMTAWQLGNLKKFYFKTSKTNRRLIRHILALDAELKKVGITVTLPDRSKEPEHGKAQEI